ncbi:MAG: sulfotransferase [Azospirillaceae bacterium]|nr:sulfotransferase [Azospirillaceae bacterium]
MTGQQPPIPASESRRIVVLLGMHRCGTSALTRGLLTLGVDLGDSLMPPNEGNRRGYWEDTEVVALNDQLLARFGHSWHTITSIPDEQLTGEATADLMLEAATLLRRKLKEGRVFAMKDPRMARLLPFWKAVFAHLCLDAAYVIAVRNPVSVAASLRRRDSFPAEKSHYLWQGHMLAALHHSAGHARVIVEYDTLMADPLPQLRRLADGLGLPLNVEEAERYARDFLTEELRHSTFDAEDLRLERSVPQEVTVAHTLLHRLAQDELSPEAPAAIATLASLTQAFDRLRPAFTYMGRMDRALGILNHQVEEQAHQIATLTQSLSTIDARAQMLVHEVRILNDVLTEAPAGPEVRAAPAATPQLRQGLVNARRLKARLAAMENSTSWRITRPLRAFFQSWPMARRAVHLALSVLTLRMLG